MAGGAYYIQECPTCGRTLQIRVEYLGKRVACQHCAAKFVAADPSSSNFEASESGISLLDRADELIESVALTRAAVEAQSKQVS